MKNKRRSKGMGRVYKENGVFMLQYTTRDHKRKAMVLKDANGRKITEERKAESAARDFLEREHRLPFRLDRWAMNPLVALILGFTFSFAWTPCVGPTLSSVLLMASSASSASKGFLLIGVYTAGFVIPFLAVGLFTGTVLGFFKRHQKVVRYTVKIGAALLILMGIMTLTGFMNGITGYLSRLTGDSTSQTQTEQSTPPAQESGAVSTEDPEPSPESTPRPVVPAPDFTLTDQYGNTHTLSDYEGKTVFLNFWATWCGPCKSEMPDIQALYESYGENEGDVIILGVASPKTEKNPFTS